MQTTESAATVPALVVFDRAKNDEAVLGLQKAAVFCKTHVGFSGDIGVLLGMTDATPDDHQMEPQADLLIPRSS